MRRFETVLKFAPTSAGGDEYVMSDGKPDRTEEVIEPAGWVIGDLIPALFNHLKNEIVGRWEDVRIVGRQLIGRLVLAEAGTAQLPPGTDSTKPELLPEFGVLLAQPLGEDEEAAHDFE